MAAPKADGMLFRGDLQGEPKPAGRLPRSIAFVRETDWHGRRSRIPAAAGRSQLSSRGA
jgi:hypothetical protein